MVKRAEGGGGVKKGGQGAGFELQRISLVPNATARL